jgi:hypothetical protein
MKRPILNRSSSGGPSRTDTPVDNVRPIGVRKTAAPAPDVARGAVAGGRASGIPGLVEQPRAAISPSASGPSASAVSAPLPATPAGVVPGKRR